MTSNEDDEQVVSAAGRGAVFILETCQPGDREGRQGAEWAASARYPRARQRSRSFWFTDVPIAERR
jgi:hypothetical protein